MSKYPIEYGNAMLARIEAMHRGAESLPGYRSWIADHMGGRVVGFRERLIPSLQFFVDLSNIRILDFGCGTGSSTVAIAEVARHCSIIGSDVDKTSLELAQQRLDFHELGDRVDLCQIPYVPRRGLLPFQSHSFDLILMNGVLEHVVPFSDRAALLREAWKVLVPGGVLYINETPNALWPVDRHTTGLPLIPWMPSSVAHRVSIWAGKHKPGSNLDARGRRGMTFWEIVNPLRSMGAGVEILNITKGENRLIPGEPGRELSAKRRTAMLILERGLGKVLGKSGTPTLALTPWIDHLCIRKVD